MSQAGVKMLRQALPIFRARDRTMTMKRLLIWWRGLSQKERATWMRRWHAGRALLRLEELNNPEDRARRLRIEEVRGVRKPEEDEDDLPE